MLPTKLLASPILEGGFLLRGTAGPLLALILGALFAACASAPASSLACPRGQAHPLGTASLQRFEYEAPKLGTLFRIVLFTESQRVAAAAAEAAFERVDELDAILSSYKDDSELNRLSALTWERAPAPPRQVSTDLFRVLSCSQEIAMATGGAFDVTMGPMVRLWRRSRRQGELPKGAHLATAAQASGYRFLRLVPGDQTALLGAKGMRLDLGGIAKGYILDEALAVLERHGIRRALLDAGGDLLASGPPPERAAWRVYVDTLGNAPSLEIDRAESELALCHGALATSGDAFQFVEIDGVRYSHLINPQTGLGLTTSIAATVLAPNAMLADAWASGLCVLGPEPGMFEIERRTDLEARCATPSQVTYSQGFSRILSPAGQEHSE